MVLLSIPLRWPQVAGYTFQVSWDRFRLSSNNKVITSTILETVVLVLLTTGIYDVRHWDGLRWRDIYVPISWKIDPSVQSILRFCLRNLRSFNVGITNAGNLWLYVVQMASYGKIYLTSFMKISRGFQTILTLASAIWKTAILILLMRGFMKHAVEMDSTLYTYQVPWPSIQVFKYHYDYYCKNLKGCNVGIADRRNLWSTPLGWLHVYILSFKKIVRGVQLY
jgi:hypothetical protein